jgi:hypothetical protein
MRMLTSAVLIFEAIVVLLAIPVAVVIGGAQPGAAWALGALSIACLVLPAAFGRSWYIWAGWFLQGLLIATGVLVPMMFILGILFAGLWFAAIHLGSKPGATRTSG